MEQEIIRIDLGGVNCYLGKEKDSYILFDTGGHLTMDKTFTNRREALEKELDKAGCTNGKLKLIVLTHGDYDHTANAAYLRDKFHVKIAMHSEDAKLAENPQLEKAMESFRYKSLIFKLMFKTMKKTITKVTDKVLKDFDTFAPDILLKEGDNLQEYGFNAEILHIPGHTLGSIAIVSESGHLICGDTFINGKKPDSAPNAADFKLLSSAVKRLRSLNIKTVYPGHGAPFEMQQYK